MKITALFIILMLSACGMNKSIRQTACYIELRDFLKENWTYSATKGYYLLKNEQLLLQYFDNRENLPCKTIFTKSHIQHLFGDPNEVQSNGLSWFYYTGPPCLMTKSECHFAGFSFDEEGKLLGWGLGLRIKSH